MMANPDAADVTVRVLQGEEGRIIHVAGHILDKAGIVRDGYVLEARIGLPVVERDRLAKEWRDVVTALGRRASPALSPSENVVDLLRHLRRTLRVIEAIASENVERSGVATEEPLTDWERIIAELAPWSELIDDAR